MQSPLPFRLCQRAKETAFFSAPPGFEGRSRHCSIINSELQRLRVMVGRKGICPSSLLHRNVSLALKFVLDSNSSINRDGRLQGHIAQTARVLRVYCSGLIAALHCVHLLQLKRLMKKGSSSGEDKTANANGPWAATANTGKLSRRRKEVTRIPDGARRRNLRRNRRRAKSRDPAEEGDGLINCAAAEERRDDRRHEEARNWACGTGINRFIPREGRPPSGDAQHCRLTDNRPAAEPCQFHTSKWKYNTSIITAIVLSVRKSKTGTKLHNKLLLIPIYSESLTERLCVRLCSFTKQCYFTIQCALSTELTSKSTITKAQLDIDFSEVLQDYIRIKREYLKTKGFIRLVLSEIRQLQFIYGRKRKHLLSFSFGTGTTPKASRAFQTNLNKSLPEQVSVCGHLQPVAIGDGEGEHTIDKRHVSVLARLGQLPYQGKRMEKSSLDELAERLEEEQHAKRYLGSLARAGELRAARDQEGKRDDFEGLVSDLAAEEMRRSRLGESPLKDDILVLPQAGGFRQFDEDDEEISGEKRSSMAVLARTGALPKRVYGIGEKRNVASLARGFQLPQNGKRNIASIVRDRSKKESYEEDMDEEKRNLPSIVRDRNEPLGEACIRCQTVPRTTPKTYSESKGKAPIADMTTVVDTWLGSHGVRLTGSSRYGRPLIGRREGARGAVAVVKGARPMRGRPDPESEEAGRCREDVCRKLARGPGAVTTTAGEGDINLLNPCYHLEKYVQKQYKK
ncbi:unnamed protein product [Nesidiocoris tenuis]|uniref:Uncharacterized protein n=1 Tax=Nesidiocoris tenuis TaxID=355587 RepID=A0A6H5G5J6_9HEMI|nr:unnamed protein product [Nesidiocoris tenuis]